MSANTITLLRTLAASLRYERTQARQKRLGERTEEAARLSVDAETVERGRRAVDECHGGREERA